MTGCRLIFAFLTRAAAHMITSILNNADHTIVPAQRLELMVGFNTANNDVKSSGALDHTAISVAPANSDESSSFFEIFSSAGTKK